MEKKLTAQGARGRQSFTVTLPKEWVLRQNLEKSKEINMEVIGNMIVISTDKKLGEAIEIDAKNYSDSLIKVLQGFYRLGIDELKIEYDNEKLLEIIVDIVNKNLIGYEIVEQRKNTLSIKYIVKESEEDFKVILRRIFLLILELSDTVGNIRTKALKDNITRLFNYCERILIKKGHLDYPKIPFYYLLLDSIEKVSDELLWLSYLKDMTKKQKDYKKNIIEMLNRSYELFYKFDTKNFNGLTNDSYKLKNDLKLSESLDTKDLHLHNLARLINSMCGNIFCINFKYPTH